VIVVSTAARAPKVTRIKTSVVAEH